jgi:hypothetical protein
VVHPKGEGASALDALVIVGEAKTPH